MQQQTSDRPVTGLRALLSRRRRLLPWLALTALLLLGGALSWWWFGRPPPLHYVTAKVSRGDIQRAISMTGALNPVVTAQVGSYVSGNIKSWTCDYNTIVKIGQSCALIDPLPFQVIVDEDEADVSTANAQLVKDRAAARNAAVIYERDRKLIAEGIVSQEALDTDKATLDQARAQVDLDAASIAAKKAALHAAQVNLGYTNIVSPVNGTVITRYIDVGQTVVSSLQSSTLFLIGKDMHSMQVDSNVSEADVGEIKPGQKANFTVQAYPNRTFVGKVRQIREGPITVQNVVTYDVVIDVDNADLTLSPGMTADAHIVTAESNAVLRVPLPAVRFTPEGYTRPSRAEHGPRVGAEGMQPGDAGPAPAVGSTAGESAPQARADRGSGDRADRARAAGDGSGHPDGESGHAGRPHAHASSSSFTRVWVLRDGKLVAVRVRTGLDDGTLIEVSGDDLHEGDLVIVNAVRPDGAHTESGDTGSRPPGGATRTGGGGVPRL